MPSPDGTHPNPNPNLSHKRNFSEDANAASPDPSLETIKKRRATATSARGVANLTPDQLAKKRANDREAQRAIRERTKNQIENLERKIRDLTSQQPDQELQQVLRQKELVEAENSDIKKRLASVLSLIQPILGQHGQ
jgi:thiamine pyrophosphate-dependent acetolactate synthase large subunit-like protein